MSFRQNSTDLVSDDGLKVTSQLDDQSLICNSYAMGCPPVRRDNPRSLANGLPCVQVDKLLYQLYQDRPCTSRYISC